MRPRREEPAIGLVFDLLPHARPAVRCFEGGGLADELSVTEHPEGGADVGRTLHRELPRKLRLGSSLPAPDACEHIEHGAAEARGTPRRHVAVVARLPEAEHGVVERGHRTFPVTAIPRGPTEVILRHI